MKIKIPMIAALFSAVALFAHKPHPYTKEQKYLVNVPVLTVYEECKEEVPDSQLIYGAPVALLEERDNGWVKIEMQDHYTAFAKKEGLIPDNPRWRTSKNLCKVSSLAGLSYSGPDTQVHYSIRLPFGALVETTKEFTANEERWILCKLADGREFWLQRGDLERPKPRSLEEVLSLTQQFLGLPYIWGGGSSEGFDCSGFVQAMLREMGWVLPRNSSQQVGSDLLHAVSREELLPGDIIFFKNPKIHHVGIHLGEELFVHSGVRNQTPKINTISLEDTDYVYAVGMRVEDPTYKCSIVPISNEVKTLMGGSWREDNPVPLEDLRLVRLRHWGFDYCIYEGELIVHKDVAEEVTEIFAELFEEKYPIEKMLLVNEYDADDCLSCEDNNSYSFCSRKAVGEDEWSYHSFGLAIDINPLLNPYARNGKIIPVNGKEFLDRTIPCRGLITEEDLLYKAFIKRGWKWGGHWDISRDYVDYQHFYKELI